MVTFSVLLLQVSTGHPGDHREGSRFGGSSSKTDLDTKAEWSTPDLRSRVVHLNVEDQVSYAIKNQLIASKSPYLELWSPIF